MVFRYAILLVLLRYAELGKGLINQGHMQRRVLLIGTVRSPNSLITCG